MRAINTQDQHQARILPIREWTQNLGTAEADSEWADVVVAQRLLMASAITAMEKWKTRGKIIIGDVDDAYHLIPPSVNAHRFWKEGIMQIQTPRGEKEVKMATPPWQQLIWGMKLAHAITTPSLELCEYWRGYNPNVYYLPNYIDGENYRPHRGQRDPDNRILIGWGGSFSHVDSWRDSYIVEALRHIVAKNDNAYIVLAGGNLKVPELLKIPDRILVTGWMSHKEWPRVLASFDIGLIPLAGVYDKYRSWLKSLEYTFMGIPWIGTVNPPTRELSQYGTVINNSVKSWERAIQNHIDNLDLFKEKAKANTEAAEKLTIQNNIDNVIKIYSTIIESVK
jgi:glycosyltransferase involved in cell wall biosynthesis